MNGGMYFMAGESKTTTNHDEIREWAEARGGKPATVKRTENDGEAGVLRIDFPGYSGTGSLEEISWDEFFKKFDEKNLAFLYQDTTSSGEESRFFKLVTRETAEGKAQSSSSGSKTAHKTDKDDEKHESKAHAKSEHKADEKQESKAHAKSEHKTGAKQESKSHSKSDKAEHKSESKSHK
jgi:hypothetical protein